MERRRTSQGGGHGERKNKKMKIYSEEEEGEADTAIWITILKFARF